MKNNRITDTAVVSSEANFPNFGFSKPIKTHVTFVMRSNTFFGKFQIEFIGFITLIGCLFNFSPVYLQWNYVDGILENNDITFQYQLIIILSLGSLGPFMFDWFLDFAMTLKNNIRKTIAFRALLALLLFVPDISDILSNIINSSSLQILYCFQYARIVWIIFLIAIKLISQDPLFSSIYTTLAVLFSSGAVLCHNFTLYEPISNSFNIAFIICMAISIGIILYISYQFFTKLRRSNVKKPTRSLSSSQMICLLYLSWIITMGMSLVIIELLKHQHPSNSTRYYHYMTTSASIKFILSIILLVFENRIMNQQEKSKLIEQTALNTQQVFVRLISHELRTPLNSAYMGLDIIFAEMVSKECSPEALDVLDQVRKSCELAVGVLNDLLSAEKLERGIMRLEKTLLPAFSFILDTISPFFTIAQQSGVSLTLHPQRQLMAQELRDVTLHADKNKINQLMKTLLGFCIGSTPKGGLVTINVSLSVRTLDSKCGKNAKKMRYLKLDISNSGVGMEQDEIEHVFQSSKVKKGSVAGEQLGGDLWICKSIMDLHNGEISVVSDGENAGSTFTINIPVNMNKSSQKLKGIDGNVVVSALGITSLSVDIQESLDGSQHRPPKHQTRTRSDDDIRLPRMRSNAMSPKSVLPALRSSRVCVSDDEFGGSLNDIPTDNEDHHPKLAWNSDKAATGLLPSHHSDEALERLRCLTTMDCKQETTEEESKRVVKDAVVTNIVHELSHLNHKLLYGNRVLVVDDSIITRKMLSRLIQDRCEEIEQANDGDEAVAIVKRSLDTGQPIDLVLMDYLMPNMNGPTAAREMREMGFEGPIIGVTGNVLPDDMEYYLNQGANKVMFKPVDINKIDYVVRGFLHTRRKASRSGNNSTTYRIS